MSYEVKHLDALSRVIEKHLSREIDQFYIEEGVASQQQVAVRNDFFASLDLGAFKISSIGRRQVHAAE
jgi:hypothetical protein